MKICYIKKRSLILALFPAMIIVIYNIFSYLTAGPTLAGKIIVIDAGHGGIDPGANRPGVLEKEINLGIALHLRDVLKGYDAKVIMTRDTDVELSGLCDNERVRGRYQRDLNARVEMIQESDADLFVSIHANASTNPKRRGIVCYYAAKSEAGKKLAYAIQEQLRTIAPVPHEAQPAHFFVLRRNKVPAVLVEVGFITNPEERALLQSLEYRRKLAEAIAEGISQYQRIAPSILVGNR